MAEKAEIQRIGNVYFPVQDVEAAVRFYQEVLGLTLKFRDGDRWVAFDVAGATLAVAGPEEVPLGGNTPAYQFAAQTLSAAAKANAESSAARRPRHPEFHRVNNISE